MNSKGDAEIFITGSNVALQLVQKGFNVLTYDLSEHGDRYSGFMEQVESDSDMGMAMLRFIEHFRKHPLVSSNKIGLISFSLGAMLTYYALTKNKEIKAAVPMIGTPNFDQTMIYGMEKKSVDDFKFE